jgi:hypothetical protein
MHPSYTCAVPDLAIIEEFLAKGKATQELWDWFSIPVTAGRQTRPPAVWGEKAGADHREGVLERHGAQVSVMIRGLAADPEFATMGFFSKSSRGDIFFSREAVEAALPGISYFHSW